MSDPFSAEASNKVDTRGVRATYERWPSLAREGFKVKVELPGRVRSKAYVLGMGGSASGGDILAGWLSGREGIEMEVFKGHLPIGDMSDAIAIASSASGQTEETILMMKTALEKGATVVSISGGGKLKEVSANLGVPHIDMPEVVAPRYMLPFIIFSTLAVVNRGLDLGAEEEAVQAFTAMDEEAKEVNISVDPSKNGAKSLALKILDKTPAIFGARVTHGVGIRFKNVLNENCKKHAYFDGVPDAFHNEIEAWEDPRTDFVPIFLRHSLESERDRERTDVMFDILTKSGKSPVQLRGRGKPSLGQLVSLVYRLDMTSYYLAVALGRDPFPTRHIDALKKST
ncbi:MAG: hypothetical protein KGI38_07590 [Thaumarchaeota archaeon]|nr:hypothetical protein [Nitrososphaerota archaeon]